MRRHIKRLGAAAMFFCLASAAAESPKAFEAYNDGAGQVVRLADEETKPFLVGGKSVMKYNDADDPNLARFQLHKKRYAKSIARFASVRDCLLDSEQKVPQPDLTKFDWKKITGESEAAVCAFRIAGSYASPEDMRRWLDSQGFKTFLYKWQNQTVLVSGSWSIDQYAARFGENIFTKAWTKIIAHGFSLSVDYVRSTELHSARASFTIT